MAAEYSPRQGHFLAFLDHFTKIPGVPPAEADRQCYFRVSPPAVHEMSKTPERQGLIASEPCKPRPIRLLLPGAQLPSLERREVASTAPCERRRTQPVGVGGRIGNSPAPCRLAWAT